MLNGQNYYNDAQTEAENILANDQQHEKHKQQFERIPKLEIKQLRFNKERLLFNIIY